MNEELNILLSATLDTKQSMKNINSKIVEIQKGLESINISLDIGDLKKQFKEVFGTMTDLAEKEARESGKTIVEELEKASKKPKFTSLESAITKGFNVAKFKKDIKELRQEIESIENVKVNYGKDASGKGIGNVDSVFVQYKDNLGRIVTETMAWADVTDNQGKVVEKRWQTIAISIDDNHKKLRDLANSVNVFKDSMGHKLDMLEQLKNIDPEKMNGLREALFNISADSGTAKEDMKGFALEVKKLTDISPSIKQMENLSNAVASFKQKANFKLDMLESTKEVDPEKIKQLRTAINGVDSSSEKATQQIKELNFEIEKTSKTSEKYADKQKSLASLESKRVQLNKNLSAVMKDSGVKDSKKNDLSKQYADIDKELKRYSKTSDEITQKEVTGLQIRMKKLQELIGMEATYQKQMNSRDTIDRRKGNMQDKISTIREADVIDPSILDDLSRRLKEVKSNSTDAKDEIDKIDDELKKVAKEATDSLGKIEKAMKDAFDLGEFKKMQGNKLDLLGDTNASKAQIESLRQRLNALQDDVPNLRHEMTALSNDIQLLGSQSEKSANSMGFLARYFGLYEAIELSKRAISSMLEAVKGLDDELMELRKVTDFSTQGLDNFTESAFKVANEIGRTGTEMIEASATFARAGFAEAELMDLAKTSLIMTNIGDGIEGVAEASGYLISALKAYRLEASKAIDVTSAINEVSNNNAIGFQNLAEGLSRTASVYSQAGTSMEEVLGLLTGAYEINRNIEKTSSGKQNAPDVQKCA